MKLCLFIGTLVCFCILGFFLSMSFCIAWGKLSYCLEGEDKRINDNCVSYGDSDNGECELCVMEITPSTILWVMIRFVSVVGLAWFLVLVC